MKASLFGIAMSSILLSTSPLWAQAYPSKVITLVVPYGAGGATDSVSRTLANKLKDILGQPVIVENKPGAGTMLAAAAVTKAPADGYTLMMITASTVTTLPHLYNKLTYKPEDLVPVSMVVEAPFALAAKKDSPFKTVKEFIAYVKANPGQPFATSGTGSTTHLAVELLAQSAGIELREVPYRSSSFGMNDVIGGNIGLAVESVALTAPQHTAGNLRVLATFSEKRSEQLPDVPTFKESGLTDVVASTWFAVAAPKGTPADVIKKLNAAVRAAVSDPDTNAKLAQAGFVPGASSPEELTAIIAKEFKIWGDVIAKARVAKFD